MKRLLYILIPLSFAAGASFVKLSQIRGDKGQVLTIPIVQLDGSLVQGKLTGLGMDNMGNIILPLQPAAPPTITVIKILPGTPIAFPIPLGKTICEISKNGVGQSPGEDYVPSNNGSNISFLIPPVVDDIIRMVCF